MYKPAGALTGLLIGTDYTVATDSSTGRPLLTYTDLTTQNLACNMNNLIVEESYRRLFPVVRDTNNIYLTNGSNNLTLTSTMIGSKTIENLITNDSYNMSMDLLTYVDSGDYVGSGPAICTLSSLFRSFIIDVSVMTSDI